MRTVFTFRRKIPLDFACSQRYTDWHTLLTRLQFGRHDRASGVIAIKRQILSIGLRQSDVLLAEGIILPVTVCVSGCPL
jgi:hypothetical protein